MRKVLLVDYNYKDGGPKTINNILVHSYLAEKYQFKFIGSNDAVLHYNPLKAIKFVNYYINLINKEHADIAYVRGLEYVGLLMTLAAKLSNVKETILVVHGASWDIPGYTLRQIILKFIVEPLEIRLSDKIFTVCQAEQRSLKPLKLAKKNANIGVIYNSFPNIDYKSVSDGKLRKMLGVSEEKIIVSSVGRVTDRKGHKYIIETLKHLKDKDFVFVIIGDGDYLSKYKELCSDDIKDGRLYLLGSRSDVYELLKDTDIFLFPTLNENHSMALLEAVNMHCAAIVTNVGGNTEIIQNGVTGEVIEPCNYKQIIDALIKLKDKKLRTKYAKAAFEYASKQFSEKNTIGKIDTLFSQPL